MSTKIICTVTNDLNYDQRMIRICNSLTQAGYDVTLVGWSWPSSKPLVKMAFHQVRLPLPWQRGKMMYLLYWWKLYRYLITQSPDIICAIDLDTIVPVYHASKKLKCKRTHDAHEIFTEMQEVNSRPLVKYTWQYLAKKYIPKFPVGYTIGDTYASFFKKHYGVLYETIRNATILKPFEIPYKSEKYILYQGAVNVGRCFEHLIPAMKKVDAPLYIIGKGNFYSQTQALIDKYGLNHKVKMLGYMRPDDLKKYTAGAWIGITLFDNNNHGLSNQFSMANRFFDYMHHGVPQLCNAYPEYEKVNEAFGLALLIDEVSSDNIADALNTLLNNESLHSKLSQGAMNARTHYNWQNEAQKLVDLYHKIALP